MIRLALAAVVAIAFTGTATTTAQTPTTANQVTPPTPPPMRCTVEGFRPFSAAVWREEAWERGMPPGKVLRARTAAYVCAAPAHRQAMKRTWRQDVEHYFKYRASMKLHRKIEPWYGCTVGGCGWWAIPAPAVNCESGGGTASSNIYANLTPFYHGGSKWEQSVSAYEVLQQPGVTFENGWLQYESGCTGWPWGLG